MNNAFNPSSHPHFVASVAEAPRQENAMQAGDLCLVTGVSGYLASWLAKDLLDRGFRVRGTVRSLADAKRLATLRGLLPGIEIVAADLRSEAGWGDAVARIDWVFHVASPQAVPEEQDRTAGAVDGTRRVLTAAFAESSVKKVVVTSSEAAIAYGHTRKDPVITEDDWTDLAKVGANADYFRSKTLAERLAWELAADRKVNPRSVPLATVNPSLILGPSLVPWGRFSLKLISDIATGKMPLMLDMQIRTVDVRDCAAMHIAVMQSPSASGHRHLSIADVGSFKALAMSISEQFGQLGYRPKARIAPAWLTWVLKFISADVKSVYSHVGTRWTYQVGAPELYQYRHRGLDALVKHSLDSVLAHGWLVPKAA